MNEVTDAKTLDRKTSAVPGQPPPKSSAELCAGIDRVLAILRQLPLAQRYGGSDTAIKEAREILEGLRGKL